MFGYVASPPVRRTAAERLSFSAISRSMRCFSSSGICGMTNFTSPSLMVCRGEVTMMLGGSSNRKSMGGHMNFPDWCRSSLITCFEISASSRSSTLSRISLRCAVRDCTSVSSLCIAFASLAATAWSRFAFAAESCAAISMY